MESPDILGVVSSDESPEKSFRRLKGLLGALCMEHRSGSTESSLFLRPASGQGHGEVGILRPAQSQQAEPGDSWLKAGRRVEFRVAFR